MRKLYSYFYKSSVLKLVLIGMFLPRILFLCLNVVFELFNLSREVPVYTKSLLWFIMVPLILAPLVETLIFQYLPLRVCQKWFRRYRYSVCTTIIFSSIVFCLMHAPLIIHMCNALLSGIIWCFLCFVLMRKKRQPVLYTTIMHAGANAIAIIIAIAVALLNGAAIVNAGAGL